MRNDETIIETLNELIAAEEKSLNHAFLRAHAIAELKDQLRLQKRCEASRQRCESKGCADEAFSGFY